MKIILPTKDSTYIFFKKNMYYLIFFLMLFFITFTYLYTSTPYYSNVKLSVPYETADGKLYLDTGYHYVEHFAIPIKNKTAYISNRFVNIRFINSIAYKDAHGEFIKLPFNANDYKAYTNIYINYQLLISLVLSACILLLFSKRNKIFDFASKNTLHLSLFGFFFTYYTAISYLLYPVISWDSAVQFTTIAGVHTSIFSLSYDILAMIGYIVLGSPQIFFLGVSLCAVTFFTLYTCLIAKKIHIYFAYILGILITTFPLLITEISITERPIVGLWAVTGLVLTIYNALCVEKSKLLFYIACFFLFLATTIRYDLCLYFAAALFIHFLPKKNYIQATAWAICVPIATLILAMGIEKVIIGQVSQFNPHRAAQNKLSVLGFLVRDNLLSNKDMTLLSKYVDIKKIKEEWQEGNFNTTVRPVINKFYDEDYPILMNSIATEYIQKYPLAFIKSRLIFAKALLNEQLYPYSRISNRPIAALKQNKLIAAEPGKALRFIPPLSASSFYSTMVAYGAKYRSIAPWVLCVLYIAAFAFIFAKRNYDKIYLLTVGAILLGPSGKMISLLWAAPMASHLYIIDIILMIYFVIPLCIPLIFNFRKRKI